MTETRVPLDTCDPATDLTNHVGGRVTCGVRACQYHGLSQTLRAPHPARKLQWRHERLVRRWTKSPVTRIWCLSTDRAGCVNSVPQTCAPGTPPRRSAQRLDDDCDGSVDEDCTGTVSCVLAAS
jgi:hypothetical protein